MIRKLLILLFLPLFAIGQSSSLITITNDMITDLNGRKNKTITRLFDEQGLVNGNTPTTKIDASGTSEDIFVLPYRSMIALPAIYGNMKFEVYESFGSGGTMTVRLYNAAKSLLGSYTVAKSAFNLWVTVNPAQGMHTHSNVRFVEIYLPTTTDLNIGDFEMRLYGDVMGTAASIYPGTGIVARSDPGKYGFGINNIDDRLQQYLQGQPTNYLLPKMAGSVRVGFEGSRFDIYPGTYDNPLGQYYDIGRFGNNHIKTRVYDFTTPNDIQVQFYHGGGSIKNLSFAEASTSNNEYHPEVNDFKYLESGADGTVLSSWNGKGELIYTTVALWGTNTSASLSGRTITGGTATAGQGGLAEIEVGNEINRDWAGAVPYHTPLEWYMVVKNCYDRAQAANSNVKILAPAVTFMDLSYWKAVYFWHFWLYGLTPFPCDGFNMNLYLNSDLDGQAQSGGSTGLNPEAWGLHSRLTSLKTLFDQIFPNKDLYMSEYGFATSSGSPYDVQAIGGKTAGQVSADMALRTEAISQTVPFIRKMYYYAFFEDGTGPFNSMGATAMTFGGGGSYTGNTVYPVGYALANRYAIEDEYKYFSTIVANGGTTGAWVVVKDHQTDPLKKLFKYWNGTHNGSSSAGTIVNVGADALSATRYTLNYGAFTATSSSASIVGTNVTVTATEGPQWLEVTYDEEPGNVAPTAAAGANQSITLPVSLVTVDGSASTDPDGTIFSYEWTKLSGPATFVITNPSSASTTITGLVAGTYVFRLSVTDNDGAEDTDDVQITVNAAVITNRKRSFFGTLRNIFRRG